MVYGIGELLELVGVCGYVSASRRPFQRGGVVAGRGHVRLDLGGLVVVVCLGERLLSDLTTQYCVMLSGGELVWVWGNNLKKV